MRGRWLRIHQLYEWEALIINKHTACTRGNVLYASELPWRPSIELENSAVTEPELRNNRLLDDLVKAFISARERLSQPRVDSSPQSPQDPSTAKRATRGPQGCPGKEIKQENTSMDKFLVKTNAKISRRSSSAGNERAEDAAEGSRATPSSSTKSIKQEPGVKNRSSEEAFTPSTPSTSMVKVKVECPVCGVGILEQYINSHLDGCLTRDEKKESLRSWRSTFIPVQGCSLHSFGHYVCDQDLACDRWFCSEITLPEPVKY
ncbi:unnamed protein product [Ranitomeya imitator]|uniref:UBZ4-type domain-containing protein n=1 Tax=Ranitomeya imitator TaxID=111125 RepID=A0ABN9LHC4_9NEOB|nr:unnamed protein product [Ranitomeya imitator]